MYLHSTPTFSSCVLFYYYPPPEPPTDPVADSMLHEIIGHGKNGEDVIRLLTNKTSLEEDIVNINAHLTYIAELRRKIGRRNSIKSGNVLEEAISVIRSELGLILGRGRLEIPGKLWIEPMRFGAAFFGEAITMLEGASEAVVE